MENAVFLSDCRKVFTLDAYQKAVETAKSMKRENMTISMIAHFTGLSPEEIEKL